MLSVILAQFDPTWFGLENVLGFLSSLPNESILSSMKTLVFKRDIRYKVFLVRGLGKDGATKSDDFLEKFQTAFGPPPPHFRKIMLQFFMMDMMEYMQGGTRAR